MRRRMRAPLPVQVQVPVPVPATAIFTRSDGIVAWQGCLEQAGPRSENIEVEGSHCGLGHNPLALHAIADRLAQAEGRWQPFERRGARAFACRDPLRGMPSDVSAAAG
jgi:hypothetical protein